MKKSQIYWLIDNGLSTIRYEGLHILFWRMLKWVLSPVGDLRVISFCRKDLTQPLGEIHPKVDLRIHPAANADIDQLVKLTEMRWSKKQQERLFKEKSIPDTINEQLAQGAKCFIGKIGSEIVHYNWIFFTRRDFDQYYIQLHNHEALCDDAFTPPDWRGKGIHGAVHKQMLIFLQQSGIRTAYTQVLMDNISSKKALQQLGWDFFGGLAYFSVSNSNKVIMRQIHPPLNPFIPFKSTNKGGQNIENKSG